MPYKTYWYSQGIVWEFYGFVSAQEIEDANTEFYNDERSDRAKYQIIDAVKVTGVEWNEHDIVSAAAHDIGADKMIRKVKVAYVAQDKDIVDKLEKYIDISKKMNISWKFKGFDNINSANEWVKS